MPFRQTTIKSQKLSKLGESLSVSENPDRPRPGNRILRQADFEAIFPDGVMSVANIINLYKIISYD